MRNLIWIHLSVTDEILKIKCDIALKARADSTSCDFWKYFSEDKYPYLRKLAMYLTAFFASTYLCEATFSTMNAVKTKNRNRISNEHLLQCVRLAVSSYEVDYMKLTDEMEK
uniref:SCAN domain-containing protein 3 n=1 Tax=Cacopsylla melanoneura TaxID=428564 RepID=A0A8D8SHG8_9HEMI